MPKKRDPDLSLFFDILHTLEDLGVPYMIIGAFAGALYGVTRVTYDIDIVVDLDDAQIDALAAAYPPPRYYADPVQMRDLVRMGIMFNIIDTTRGEKADLIPLTMVSDYRTAFRNRIRQTVETPDYEPLSVWCARPQDVIVGKLGAWAEGHSRKHETDVYEMLVFHNLGLDPELGATFDSAYIARHATALGQEVAQFWQAVQARAREEAERQQRASRGEG